MENDANVLSTENKIINKVRSHNDTLKTDKVLPVKRKSFTVNEAVHSLDLALERLKKTKLAHGEHSCNSSPNSYNRDAHDLYVDMNSSINFNCNIENSSLMSMNFSHYELMRNLSHSNCNSDGAVSGNTCSKGMTSAESSVKDEHLEKYFRSAEIWENYRGGRSNGVPFEFPER